MRPGQMMGSGMQFQGMSPAVVAVATSDGGVVVIAGPRTVKFDKDLNLVGVVMTTGNKMVKYDKNMNVVSEVELKMPAGMQQGPGSGAGQQGNKPAPPPNAPQGGN